MHCQGKFFNPRFVHHFIFFYVHTSSVICNEIYFYFFLVCLQYSDAKNIVALHVSSLDPPKKTTTARGLCSCCRLHKQAVHAKGRSVPCLCTSNSRLWRVPTGAPELISESAKEQRTVAVQAELKI